MRQLDPTHIGDFAIRQGMVVAPDDPLRRAQRLMRGQAVRSVLVVRAGRFVGCLSWRDVAAQDGSVTIGDVMATGCPRLTPDMRVADAWTLLVQDSIDLDFLPVVDVDGTLLGQVPRSALAARERVTDATTRPVEGGWLRVARGMAVVGSDHHRLGRVFDAIVSRRGVLNAVVVEHGSVWRQHKRLPADLIRGVEGDTLQLLLTREEFAQVALRGSSWMWWKHTRVMR